MGRKKLKNWVVNLLLFNIMLSFFLLGADCESLTIYIISKIVAGLIIIINSIILQKYSDIFED